MTICPFCNQLTDQRTQEHVIPRKMRETFQREWPKLYTDTDLRGKALQGFSIPCCDSCNNYFSQFDDINAALLEPDSFDFGSLTRSISVRQGDTSIGIPLMRNTITGAATANTSVKSVLFPSFWSCVYVRILQGIWWREFDQALTEAVTYKDLRSIIENGGIMNLNDINGNPKWTLQGEFQELQKPAGLADTEMMHEQLICLEYCFSKSNNTVLILALVFGRIVIQFMSLT